MELQLLTLLLAFVTALHVCLVRSQSLVCPVGTEDKLVNIEEGLAAGEMVLDIADSFSNVLGIFEVYPNFNVEGVIMDNFERQGQIIRTKVVLDREAMARELGSPAEPLFLNYTIVNVNVDDSIVEVLGCIHLKIRVLDKNDNSPSFSSDMIDITFNDDDDAVGERRRLLLAVDDDEGENGTQTYMLEDDMETFHLDVKTDGNEIESVWLMNTRPLDREEQGFYTLTLIAAEGREDGDTATLTVNVIIEDFCDESPVFDTYGYTPSVLENSTVSTTVVNITAIDRDIGSNGEVTYSVTDICSRKTPLDLCRPLDHASPFYLDTESGILTLTDELDREKESRFEITVQADDGCGGTATATVTVTVEDVNDNAPEVSYDGIDMVSENTRISNSGIGVIDASDMDEGVNAEFTIQLFDNTSGILQESDTFAIVDRKLALQQALNRETQDSYNLVILAQDRGTPSLSSSYSFTITVIDYNDNDPIFDPVNGPIEIREDSHKNQFVYMFHASDDDIGTNAEITYELPSSNSSFPHQHLFKIEATSGRLLVEGELDREEQEVLSILVVAKDNPTETVPQRSSSIVADITLLDVNDNAPVILLPSEAQEIVIPEDQLTGYEVVQVEAEDIDTEEHATLTYSINSTLFHIDVEGLVTLEGSLDYEVNQIHYFTITVSDGELTNSTTITVHVDNVNDVAPAFDFGFYEATVRENMDVDTSVTRITASDGDSPVGDLVFSIVSGSGRERFRIESPSGQIYTTVSLDREDVANYTLYVRVNDGLLNSASDAKVFIVIGDENERFELIDAPYEFEVMENEPIGEIVGTITVVDFDEKENGVLQFRILEGDDDGMFTIHNETGVIKTSQVLDRESIPNSEVILSVEVRDLGTPTNFVETVLVQVGIGDDNDQTPKFTPNSVSLSVRESFPTGDVFYTAQATDDDIHPNNIITYSFFSEDDPNIELHLHIDPSTGELSLATSLNFEDHTSLDIIIRATDGRPDEFDDLQVHIDVEDDPDKRLKFPDDFTPFYNIPENVGVNYTIYSFEVTDRFDNPVSRLEYTLTNLDGSGSDEFGIYEVDLVATIHALRADLDRDAFGEAAAKFSLNLTVQDKNPPSPDESYGFITSVLTITLEDVNDNAPKFEENLYTFSISENNEMDEVVGSVEANDPDRGANGSVSYSIEGSAAVLQSFRIDEETGEIEVLNSLDHESNSLYEFTVRAEDAGDPQMTGETTVVVNVEDVNDNAPQFDPTQNKSFVFSESQELGLIETLRVNDEDSGVFGEVVVEVVPGHRIDETFYLDPSGELHLVSSLDRESQDFYTFTVRARDNPNGFPTLYSDEVIVNVTVIDFNDHAPVFVNDTCEVHIPENHPTQTVFATVWATDEDVGANAQVEYALADETYSKIFCVGRGTGQIQLCYLDRSDFLLNNGRIPPVIDYERVTSYEIQIIAYDKGTPRQFSNKTCTIFIDNVNEHRPEFDATMLSAYVNEKEAVDTLVATLRAYDGDNDDVEYTITMQTPHSHFHWDDRRVAIVTTRELDYDQTNHYLLTLMASEVNGPKETTINVEIFVNNINDHTPEFETDSTTVTVSEDLETGSAVFTVRATDADNATNDAVSYSISDGNDDDVFEINCLNGTITVKTHLNFEETTEYTLTILATDTGSPPLTSEPMVVTVVVTNENDEEPVFTEPGYTFTLEENNADGMFVGQVVAEDDDVGSFGMVYYTITTGDTEFFEIGDESGEIRVRTGVSIDREEHESFSFTVQASDMSPLSPQTATVVVTVIIVDRDDNTPQFSSEEYLLYITSDQETREVFGSVDASDPDESPNNQFRYVIFEQDEGISCNITQSGGLSLLQPIPSEFEPSYILNIHLVDPEDGTKFDEAMVMLIVETGTDHHPRFEKQRYEIDVFENTEIGTKVFDISEQVSDVDTGVNGALSYALDSESGLFLLDEESGKITLEGELDFEDTQSYEVTIKATDATPTHPRTATATVAFIIRDYNDEAPRFIDAPSTITLSPVPFTEVQLFSVRAEDRDSGVNGQVQYSIVDDHSELFLIDADSGTVTNRGPLNAVQSYSFVIRAFDLGSRLMSSNITVTVNIEEPGDEAPDFNNLGTVYVRSIKENLPPATITAFTTIPTATSYHIVYSNASEGMFAVGETTGLLVSEGNLDYEIATNYRLIVEARRVVSSAQYSSYLQVDLSVLDANDNSPEFSPSEPKSFSEDTEMGLVLFSVMATDIDDGTNGQVRYDIISGNTGLTFGIDSTSGDITLEKPLDRETTSSYQLLIRATDGGVSDSKRDEITVLVNVMDVNDYIPTFEGNYTLGVFETPHTRPEDTITYITAVDEDTGPELSYNLYLIAASFQGAPRSAPVDTFFMHIDTGEITLKEELDREEIDHYLLRITAEDQVHTTETYLNIEVLDVNDNDPVLSVPDTVRVWELDPEGYLVTNEISATDGDVGSNGGVIFQLGEGWPEGTFEIHPLSGVIRVKEPFTSTTFVDVLEGEVLAVDQGVPPRVAIATVTVELQDINNHAPQFEQPYYEIAISLDTPRDTIIFKFNISENNDYEGNAGMCVIRIPSYFNEVLDTFAINNCGELKTHRVPHRELELRNYTFRVEASERLPNPYAPHLILATYAEVKVVVYPVNRNPPEFNEGNYHVDVDENFAPSVIVPFDPQVSASDGDDDEVQYSIEIEIQDQSLPFTIDAASGHISLLEDHSLDRESIDHYEFTILAIDSGFPPQTGTATVTITVLDINDEPPMFSDPAYEGEVEENSVINTSVLTVSARDEDLGTGGEIRYEIVPDQVLPFMIDDSTGEITTTASIDFDMDGFPGHYSFEVKASDGDGLSSTATVVITVLGVNEFPPEIEVPSEGFTFRATPDAKAWDEVGRIVATDRDGGKDGELTFSFSNEEPKEYFIIGRTNGSIILIVDTVESSRAKRATDDSEFFTIVAEVEVTDSGDPPSSETVDVELLVHNSFNRDGTEPTTTDETGASSAVAFEIIGAVVGVVLLAIVIFAAVMITAYACRRKRKTKTMKVSDTEQVRNNEYEMRYSSQNGSYASSIRRGTNPYPEQTTLHHGSISGSDNSSGRHSYGAFGALADDEMDSMNGESNGYPTHSPGLPKKSPVRPRSTSDLASSPGTDMLTNSQSQETGPYTKAQLAAIYAANEDLLANDGSQDSVHMFGSEGGGEADGEVDLDTILMSKYDNLDDEEDSTTMAEDDASYSGKDHQSTITDSSGNLDVPPVEERVEPYQFSSPGMKSWIPRASSMTDTINELASYVSNDPMPPRRQVYGAPFDPSQGTSLYGASSQGSKVSLLRHQQKHFDPNRQVPIPPYAYYQDSPEERHIHRAARSHRYGSETALMDTTLMEHPSEHPRDHHPMARHMHYSQDLPPYHRSHNHYIPGRPRTPPSSTPTDGTVTPHTALASDYDPIHYLSSSSTSLASTNLSQPVVALRHPRYHH